MSAAHGLVEACCWTPALWCWVAKSVDAWGEASAGAEEPPENQPPTAWPIEEPTATPLEGVLVRIWRDGWRWWC